MYCLKCKNKLLNDAKFCNKCGAKTNKKNNKFKKIKYTIISIFILLILLISASIIQSRNKLINDDEEWDFGETNTRLKEESYIFNNIEENRYHEDVFRFSNSSIRKTYWEVEGLIKNISCKRYLNSIVSKVYTKDGNNILIAEGYADVKKELKINESHPFKIKNITLNRKDGAPINKYFNKDDDVRIDTYPYFDNDCLY